MKEKGPPLSGGPFSGILFVDRGLLSGTLVFARFPDLPDVADQFRARFESILAGMPS